MGRFTALLTVVATAALVVPAAARAVYVNQTVFYDGFDAWSSLKCGYGDAGWTYCDYGGGVIVRETDCDGHTAACTGNVPYNGSYHLKFENHDSPPPGLAKNIDLSGCNKVYVSFAWAKFGLDSENGEHGTFRIDNGTKSVLALDTGSGTAIYSFQEYELKALGVIPSSSVWFVLTSKCDGGNDEFYVDEFKVECEVPQCGDGLCDALESCASCAQDCAVPEGPSQWNCGDLIDNDCDGKIDCSDSDCTSEPGCVPEFTSFSFEGTTSLMNVNWNTEYGGTSVKVECTLNGAQQCLPYPYAGQPGGGSCSIASPAYVMTPDGSLPHTVANTLFCAAYDASSPTQRTEKTVQFYPVSIEVAVPTSMNAVVGESQNLQISVKNNGTLSDTYDISVVSTNPTLLDVSNGEQTSQLLGTNDVQQLYSGLTLLATGQTATANVVVSSSAQPSIQFSTPVSVKGTEKSLPEFGVLGLLQIIAAAALLASFLF